MTASSDLGSSDLGSSDLGSPDLDRRGVGFGAASYVLWGLFPVYWPLLAPAAPVEVLAHRVLWTLVFMAGVLTVLSGWGALRSLSSRAGRWSLRPPR